ncbi:DUF928 domain-containing protein [Cronbergia sp. UHCC 0137]|uniref:DUF928 domain-containing protein n=1 Tax=Cronbergia sp. UHCC 0137 TaxID=3110239 RepID=UPI002B1EB2A4|nr:DUF928 domain-containing protein [Cronbergia sp. UHCC 0137]MEA5616439.1 DUF928 domain-containing protein [Cronbergia sp. UHCC 0137]
MQKYIGLTLLAISLMSTPVQAQIKFQRLDQTVVHEIYRLRRQERNYAGCRCGCRQAKKLLAIVPNNTPSLTVSSSPGFFVHLPKIEKQYIDSPDGKLEAEFSLIAFETDEIIYQTKIAISDSLHGEAIEGIMEINLPENIVLEVGKDYLWRFDIYCNADDPSIGIYISGIVKRVESSTKLISELKSANPLQASVIYAKNGIWVEAISTLAQLRWESPQNLKLIAYWRSLLKSVDLEDISQQPLLK